MSGSRTAYLSQAEGFGQRRLRQRAGAEGLGTGLGKRAGAEAYGLGRGPRQGAEATGVGVGLRYRD